MTIHILVEGPSERAFLEPWVVRLLKKTDVRVHPHQGKGSLPTDLNATPNPKHRGLLDQLPAKLRGFAKSLNPGDGKIVVLVDADDDDQEVLTEHITHAAQQIAPDVPFVVRLAVEETEAFYLGDLRALELAFPSADMEMARSYVPDSICGTWELFGKIVGDAGGNKRAWAEALGPLLTTQPAQNRSPSFRRFVQSLRQLSSHSISKKKARRYRHEPKNRRDPSGRR